jgi:PIN domain nuclease of toxin-antitoxin system
VRLLLDTHALIWWLTDDDHLSADARSAIAAAENQVFASACSGYEIAYKQQRGRLPSPSPLPVPIADLIRRALFTPLPITPEHAEAAGKLPGPHRDPWDRIMIAQAVAERCHMVTVDKVFSDYGIAVIW